MLTQDAFRPLTRAQSSACDLIAAIATMCPLERDPENARPLWRNDVAMICPTWAYIYERSLAAFDQAAAAMIDAAKLIHSPSKITTYCYLRNTLIGLDQELSKDPSLFSKLIAQSQPSPLARLEPLLVKKEGLQHAHNYARSVMRLALLIDKQAKELAAIAHNALPQMRDRLAELEHEMRNGNDGDARNDQKILTLKPLSRARAALELIEQRLAHAISPACAIDPEEMERIFHEDDALHARLDALCRQIVRQISEREAAEKAKALVSVNADKSPGFHLKEISWIPETVKILPERIDQARAKKQLKKLERRYPQNINAAHTNFAKDLSKLVKEKEFLSALSVMPQSREIFINYILMKDCMDSNMKRRLVEIETLLHRAEKEFSCPLPMGVVININWHLLQEFAIRAIEFGDDEVRAAAWRMLYKRVQHAPSFKSDFPTRQFSYRLALLALEKKKVYRHLEPAIRQIASLVIASVVSESDIHAILKQYSSTSFSLLSDTLSDWPPSLKSIFKRNGCTHWGNSIEYTYPEDAKEICFITN